MLQQQAGTQRQAEMTGLASHDPSDIQDLSTHQGGVPAGCDCVRVKSIHDGAACQTGLVLKTDKPPEDIAARGNVAAAAEPAVLSVPDADATVWAAPQ
eukprot:2600455-Amphidinium_carterae.1